MWRQISFSYWKIWELLWLFKLSQVPLHPLKSVTPASHVAPPYWVKASSPKKWQYDIDRKVRQHLYGFVVEFLKKKSPYQCWKFFAKAMTAKIWTIWVSWKDAVNRLYSCCWLFLLILHLWLPERKYNILLYWCNYPHHMHQHSHSLKLLIWYQLNPSLAMTYNSAHQ